MTTLTMRDRRAQVLGWIFRPERDGLSREEAAKRLVVRQIQLMERLLARQLSDADQLTAYSLDDLRDLAERLERELGR